MRPAAVGVAAALLGSAVALLALSVHRAGGAGLPWGLGLAVAASTAGSLGVRAASPGPAAVFGYGAGWCAAVLLALGGRPEGDYVIGGDLLGWGFLVLACGGVVLVTVVGALTGGPGRRGAFRGRP